MTCRLGLMGWATGALALVAVAGCAGTASSDPTGASTPASSSSPSAPVTSPPPSSPSDSAASDATALVRRYFAVVDSVRRDPTVALRRLKSVATGTQLSAEQRLVSQERAKGLRQTGATTLAAIKVQSVNLDNSDPSAGQVPQVTIDVCWDVSQADLVDKTGKSVVAPNRPNRGWTRYSVANRQWSGNPTHGWRITTSQDLQQAPCAV